MKNRELITFTNPYVSKPRLGFHAFKLTLPMTESLTYRGFTVYKWTQISFHYVFHGISVTERMGCNPSRAKEIIDDFHDSSTESNSCAYHAFGRMQSAFVKGCKLEGDDSKLQHCPASKQDNECGSCRSCWDKSEFRQVYKKH